MSHLNFHLNPTDFLRAWIPYWVICLRTDAGWRLCSLWAPWAVASPGVWGLKPFKESAFLAWPRTPAILNGPCQWPPSFPDRDGISGTEASCPPGSAPYSRETLAVWVPFNAVRFTDEKLVRFCLFNESPGSCSEMKQSKWAQAPLLYEAVTHRWLEVVLHF